MGRVSSICTQKNNNKSVNKNLILQEARTCRKRRSGNSLTLPAPTRRVKKSRNPLHPDTLFVTSAFRTSTRRSKQKLIMGIRESKSDVNINNNPLENECSISYGNISRKRKRTKTTYEQVQTSKDDSSKNSSDIENLEDVFNSPSKRGDAENRKKELRSGQMPNKQYKEKGIEPEYLTFAMVVAKYRILANHRKLDGLYREKIPDKFGRLVYHYRDEDCKQRAIDIKNGDWKYVKPKIKKSRPHLKKKNISSIRSRSAEKVSACCERDGNGNANGLLTRGRTRKLRRGYEWENSPPGRKMKKNEPVILSSQKLHCSGKQPNMHIPMQIFFPGEVELTINSNMKTSSICEYEKVNPEAIKVETPWFGHVEDCQKIQRRSSKIFPKQNESCTNEWDESLCYDADEDDLKFLSKLNKTKRRGCSDMQIETFEQIIEIFELEWEISHILQNVRVFRSDSKKFEAIAPIFCENSPELKIMRSRCRDVVIYSSSSKPLPLINNGFMCYPFNRKGTLNEAEVGKIRIKSLYKYWIQKRQKLGSLLRQFQKSDLLQNWTGTIQPRTVEQPHEVLDGLVVDSDFEKCYKSVKEIISRSCWQN